MPYYQLVGIWEINFISFFDCLGVKVGVLGWGLMVVMF